MENRLLSINFKDGISNFTIGTDLYDQLSLGNTKNTFQRIFGKYQLFKIDIPDFDILDYLRFWRKTFISAIVTDEAVIYDFDTFCKFLNKEIKNVLIMTRKRARDKADDALNKVMERTPNIYI